MRKVDNFCVGCPQGCIYCGRKHVVHYICDSEDCDADTIDGETKLYEYMGKQYCRSCIIDKCLTDFIRDMEREHGAEWVTENFEEVEDG